MTRPRMATPTLARIYARQGLTDRARQIYRKLLEDAPGDPALQAALERLDAPTEAPAREDVADGESNVRLARAGETIECSWRVSDSGLRGARLLLGGPGRLTLRTAAFLGEEVVLKDVDAADTTGRFSLEPPARALLVSAVIGLRGEDERFVAIAHADRLGLGETA